MYEMFFTRFCAFGFAFASPVLHNGTLEFTIDDLPYIVICRLCALMFSPVSVLPVSPPRPR